jgi:hypothetical protein
VIETVLITASPVTPVRSSGITLIKASRLEKSPFNVVNPPNKTIIDAMHGTFSDMNQVSFYKKKLTIVFKLVNKKASPDHTHVINWIVRLMKKSEYPHSLFEETCLHLFKALKALAIFLIHCNVLTVGAIVNGKR